MDIPIDAPFLDTSDESDGEQNVQGTSHPRLERACQHILVRASGISHLAHDYLLTHAHEYMLAGIRRVDVATALSG